LGGREASKQRLTLTVFTGTIGVQPFKDVTLGRYAYVASKHRSKGRGGLLLDHLLQHKKGAILIGTWAAVTWAIRFDEKHALASISVPARPHAWAVCLLLNNRIKPATPPASAMSQPTG
jgi:hypothetical protein